MSFHFQPAADSSDEDEVDLSAWQGAATKKPKASPRPPPPAPVAPTAPMYAPAGDEEDEDNINISTFQQPQTARSSTGPEIVNLDDDEDDEPMGLSIDGGEDKSESETPQIISDTRTPARSAAPRVSSGFTSINRPTRATSSRSQSAELFVRESRPKNKQKEKARVKLVPIVDKAEGDDDDVLDYTTGGDVVLLVKKELPSRRGKVRYMVEFEDFTVREVRFLFLYVAVQFCFLLSCHNVVLDLIPSALFATLDALAITSKSEDRAMAVFCAIAQGTLRPFAPPRALHFSSHF